MSKSILVVDTPSCCGECPMSVTMACKKRMFFEDCLLRHIPERKKLGDFVSSMEDMKVVGWNACLEEILKENSKMTNADRIRNMSNEELAKEIVVPFMYMNGYRASIVYQSTHCQQFNTEEEALQAELEWLESEVNEDKL